ncbi:metallopeptidase [Nocardioides sp. OK12]|uniref:M1 family metallopeptidase n=1 Tax=Nocardioides sp. OK12 TaxID=2758661 RepID=UPI0021C39BDA|nr:M1 family metallopeptidase [Nocardioides sp. OK12]GHJ59473.1 metallopeptidase [Nocardioides sp. OK12]
MPTSPRRRARPAPTLAALALAATLLPGAPASARPAGDTLFPSQGNSGYQVRVYDVAMDYQPLTNRARTRVLVRASAKRTLDSFHLDFSGPRVTEVLVDGVAAQHRRTGAHELVVTPSEPVRRGRFTVSVSWQGEPPEHTDADGSTEGWVRTSDGAVALGEPVGAMTWLPSNNTPGDKARFRYAITVPTGYEVAANGDLVGRDETATSTTWRWDARDPMATYLAMVAIGQFDVHESATTSVDGRTIPIWSFTDPTTGDAADAREALPGILAFNEELFGPYPFTSAGLVVDDARVGYALETQTRAFYPPGAATTSTVVHEVAHQWVGNAVTLTDWHDIWLAEGFATYAEWLYAAEHGGPRPGQRFKALYARPASDDLWSPAPTRFTDSSQLFGAPVYTRGAMTLHALRQRVGDADFFAILRAWVRRHHDANVTTRDLLRLSERVSGEELDGLFREWLVRDGKPRGY